MDLINAGEGNRRQSSGLWEVGRTPSPAPHQGLWGHNQHMHLSCLYLQRRKRVIDTVEMMPTTPPSMGVLLTFFKTDSRCFLVIPEWRQDAFRHKGRSDTCRYNAVTAQYNLISSP